MALTGESRPRYWEWRVELERSRDRLSLAVMGLGLGCVVLLGLLTWEVRRPVPIYYVTGAIGAAWPGQVPDTLVEEFGSRVVLLIGNLNAATARRVYDVAHRYLSPAMSARLAVQAREDLAAIEQQRLGVSFTQTEVAVVGKRPDPPAWQLAIRGVRASWAGQQLLAQDSVEYQVRVIRAPATELNPYGLAVESVELKNTSREARRE